MSQVNADDVWTNWTEPGKPVDRPSYALAREVRHASGISPGDRVTQPKNRVSLVVGQLPVILITLAGRHGRHRRQLVAQPAEVFRCATGGRAFGEPRLEHATQLEQLDDFLGGEHRCRGVTPQAP